MTAITLNLLSEEQIAQEASARDPFRTAIGIGAALLSCVALSGSLLSVFASQLKTELSLLRTKWDTISTGQAQSANSDWQTAKSVADDICAINRQRAMCAPQLALIKDLIPDSVQLIRFGLTMATEVQAGTDAPATDDSSGKKARRARLPLSVERMTLRLEGRAVSRRPEMEVDALMQTLRTHPVFSAGVEQVQLRSISRYAATGNASTANLPVASFVIECQYKERK